MTDPRTPPACVPEPLDETTPVSTYQSQFNVKIREMDSPAVGTPVVALPTHRPASMRAPAPPSPEPTVIVDGGTRIADGIDSQPDTLHVVRRRKPRALELALVATISALLAAVAALVLARTAASQHSGTSSQLLSTRVDIPGPTLAVPPEHH